MDFNVPFGDLDDIDKNVPELKPNEVWAATLKISVVKFPSPKHAAAFFRAVTAMVDNICQKLGMDVVESITALGTAIKKDDNNEPPEIDLSKYKN